MTIADSAASDNEIGIFAQGGSTVLAIAQVVVVNSIVANNGDGILQGMFSQVYLGKNTIAGNATAFSTIDSSSLLSFGDNYIKGNGDDGGAISLVATK